MNGKTILAALALVPSLALAQMQPMPPPTQRSTNWQFAVRSAYAVPFGKSTSASGDELSQVIKSDIPLALEVNYRLNDEVYLGGMFQYGFGSLSSPLAAACAGASCSASTLRFGVNAFWHVSPKKQLDPWLGIGMNYEQMKVSRSDLGGSEDLTISGLEFLNMQFGVDFQASHLFAVGPYMSAGLGQYVHVDAGGTSGDISNKAVHGWLNFGLKMTFNP
jgi:outer membrane protein W